MKKITTVSLIILCGVASYSYAENSIADMVSSDNGGVCLANIAAMPVPKANQRSIALDEIIQNKNMTNTESAKINNRIIVKINGNTPVISDVPGPITIINNGQIEIASQGDLGVGFIQCGSLTISTSNDAIMDFSSFNISQNNTISINPHSYGTITSDYTVTTVHTINNDTSYGISTGGCIFMPAAISDPWQPISRDLQSMYSTNATINVSGSLVITVSGMVLNEPAMNNAAEGSRDQAYFRAIHDRVGRQRETVREWIGPDESSQLL